MKREIKFRGKSVDNNEWVYGDLIHIGNGCIIYQGSQSDYEITNKTGVAIELFDDEVSVVRPETLGQFTGLCDKNGVNCVFEGDILSLHGTLIGNIYENKDLLKDETNFVINGLCTKEWCYTYQEAIKRGCVDAK